MLYAPAGVGLASLPIATSYVFTVSSSRMIVSVRALRLASSVRDELVALGVRAAAIPKTNAPASGTASKAINERERRVASLLRSGSLELDMCKHLAKGVPLVGAAVHL